MTADLSWTRAQLEALAASGQEEDLRTVELDEAAARITSRERVVALVASSQLQAIALSDDATEAPPQDRAWFRVLDEAERASVESDLEQAERISERLRQGPVNDALFRARVLESHGLAGETLTLLRERIAALTPDMSSEEIAPLVRYEQNLSASVEAAWQPEAM